MNTIHQFKLPLEKLVAIFSEGNAFVDQIIDPSKVGVPSPEKVPRMLWDKDADRVGEFAGSPDRTPRSVKITGEEHIFGTSSQQVKGSSPELPIDIADATAQPSG